MRIVAAAITGFAALVAIPQAASACDLEGFGYTRMNPFAQHTAWNVPAEQQAQQSQPQDKAATSSASSNDAASQPRQASTASTRSTAQAAAITPVSVEASASQSQWFTATKD
ncbi:hypothetical protein [Blastomonas sp. SL216]|uniref:hypothetical protein n=1 Tax=Blastomonas sp. SL216 TaxID=2995169 RepID=UPI002377726C|nr:hypothetical protein OU999_07790 [Blastomonas sp. SL216]